MLTTFGPNKSLLTAFNDCKVKYMVVGGLAVKYYCANRKVDDLDLLVSPTMKNAINIAQAFAKMDSQGLKEVDFDYALSAERICKLHSIIEDDFCRRSEFGVQITLKHFLYAEILTPLPDFDFCASYINSVEGKINDVPARIISCRDLFSYKQSRIEHLDRELDGEKRDIKMLSEVCGP